MTSLEPDVGAISSWRNGLMLALLVWLLTWLLYNQTFNSAIPAADFHQVFTNPAGQMYPPPLALALRPLAKLPLEAAVHLWFFICVVSLLLSVGLFARSAGIELHDAAPLGILLIIGFHFRPTALDFWEGAFIMPVLTLLCAAYLADSRERPYSLAACIAVAAMIKPWMLGLLIYLLIRRKPLAFLWGLSLFTGVVGLFLVRQGWGDWFSLPRAMGRLFVVDLPDGFRNQSILGFARAHFLASSEASPWVNDPRAFYAAAAGGFVALSIGLGLAARRAPSARGDHARLLLGITVVSLLLALPVCPRGAFVLLLPAIWTLLTIDAVSTAVRGAAVVVYAVFTRPFTGHQPPGWMQIVPSAFFLAAVLLWLVLLASIRRRRPSHAAAYFR